jgi:hypothetical protein
MAFGGKIDDCSVTNANFVDCNVGKNEFQRGFRE